MVVNHLDWLDGFISQLRGEGGSVDVSCDTHTHTHILSRYTDSGTCLYSQPLFITGAFRFLLMELDRFPKLWTFLEDLDGC